MAVDWDSPKRERKEFMYYTTEWEANDHLNNTIRCSHEPEGKFMQQTKETRTKLNPNGEELVQYVGGPARKVYAIPKLLRFDIRSYGLLNQLTSTASCRLVHFQMPAMIMESFSLWHLNNSFNLD